MIKAKPVVSNKFWILQDGNRKIGEINASRDGYTINIKGGRSASYDSISSLTNSTGIAFTDNKILEKHNNKVTSIHGYPTVGEVHNPAWNTQLQLPVYNKKEISKSWSVAGYFIIKIKDTWKTILCPKLIILKRNKYHGPYRSMPENNDSH